MSEKPKPEVHIYAGADLGTLGGVILLLPTGVIWSTQAGGVACNHPQAEGIFVPLYVGRVEQSFPDGRIEPREFPHLGCWGETSHPDDAEKIQAAIDQFSNPLVVDETRWSEAQEAWWPVIVSERAHRLTEYDALHPFLGVRGWLITENCD